MSWYFVAVELKILELLTAKVKDPRILFPTLVPVPSCQGNLSDEPFLLQPASGYKVELHIFAIT